MNGTRLRRVRERRGYRRTELRDKANVGLSYLKYIEAGDRQPSAVVVHRIARALGVSFTEFCDPTDDTDEAGAA